MKNKIALVTGGGQGIGKAVALTLASYGAKVVVTDINRDRATATSKEILAMGEEGMAIAADVSVKEEVQSMIDETIQSYGRIDILVNCAGIIHSSLLIDLDEKMWDRVMDVNAKGVFLCCQLAAKEMMKVGAGKIINISSIAAKTGEIGNGVYCASKAAVSMLTQTLALELAP